MNRPRKKTLLLAFACLAIAQILYAAHGANYYHWGVSWSSDSKWVLYHTAWTSWESSPLTEGDLGRGVRGILNVQSGRHLPFITAANTHRDPKTGRVFVFSVDGLFTLNKGKTDWSLVDAWPANHVEYFPTPGILVISGPSRYDRDNLYVSSATGKIVELTPKGLSKTEAVSTIPAPEALNYLLAGAEFGCKSQLPQTRPAADCPTTFTTAPTARRPDATWLEQSQGIWILHCRNGKDPVISSQKLYDSQEPNHVEVLAARLAPDGKKAALVLSPRYPMPPTKTRAGTIVVFDLSNGAILARVDSWRIASDTFGQ